MKIVYVLTSDKQDFYLEQLAISLASLRLYNPDISVDIVVDSITESTLTGNRRSLLDLSDSILTIETPVEYGKLERSRWLKTNLRNIVKGDFLFLDTDTVVCGQINSFEMPSSDICAVRDLHVNISKHTHKYDILAKAEKIGWIVEDEEQPFFNSGVMYVKDSELARDFYDSWSKEWIVSAYKGCVSDQPSLCKTNALYGHIITQLDDKWNCQVTENGIRFLNSAIIIHYFASGQKLTKFPYIFNDRDIYIEVRNKGISDKIQGILSKPKGAFCEKTQLISDKDVDFFQTPLCQYLRKFYYSSPNIYKKIVDFGRKFKHL